MKEYRTTFTELIVKGLMLFSIFTVIQSFPMLDSVNRVLLACVVVALVAKMMSYRYTIKQFCMLMLTVAIHIIAIWYTDFPMVNTNMLFYFLIWVLLYVFFTKSRKRIIYVLRNADIYINVILWAWTLLVGISAVLPAGYDGPYFISFAGNSFRFMMAVLIVTALAMYMAIKKENKWYNLFLILPTYAALMNQSRTYFAVYFMFLFMYFYMEFKSKKAFYVMLIPSVFVLLILMSISGIADKLTSVLYTETSYFDFWTTVTSGRSLFWKYDIEAFFALPFWQQFVGNGFNFVYDINRIYFAEIWAHNDVINILMNFGYIGLVIYLWAFIKMVNAFGFKQKQIPLMVKSLFLGAIFVNSMFNMSYTYICAMISYPFFLCVISEKYGIDE